MPTSSRCSGYEFAVNFRKNGLFCRVDVGIDPYRACAYIALRHIIQNF